MWDDARYTAGEINKFLEVGKSHTMKSVVYSLFCSPRLLENENKK